MDITTNKDLGIILTIEEVKDFDCRPVGPSEGSKGARAGLSQMLGFLVGHSSMEGFRVLTDKHEILVLIDGQQSCCEDWGYIHSEENLTDYVGAKLIELRLTDTALNSRIIERHGHGGEYGFDDGGIQFVDLTTSKGKLQLAVYNAHNGYYGHGIVVAVDKVPIMEDTL